MKIVRTILISLVAVLAFAACEPSDSERDLGFPVLYIPQATITGLDNTYPIPNGPLNQNSKYVCKYDDASGKLDINVGVVRAGFIKNAKGFSVDLKVCDTETQNKLSDYSDKGTPAMALPESVCSIPAKITVEAGKNSNSCYVSIDMKELAKQKSSIISGSVYKILVLGLEIANPTTYELAESNTTVAICLDLNSEEWDNASSPIRSLFPAI